MAAIINNKAVGEMMASIYIAKQFPRDLVEVTRRLNESCSRLKLAEKATYSYPRGGSTVTGPSIRLAEVLVGAWGNMDAGWQIISRRFDPRKNHDIAECVAFAWDKETNIRREILFEVPLIREKRSGDEVLTSERDIYELCANMASRRIRACILQVLPGWLVEEAMDRVQATLESGDTRPMADRVRSMLAAFVSLGVTESMVEKWLGHPVAEIKKPELLRLGREYNALKDGLSTVREIFGTPEKDIKPASLDSPKPDAPPAQTIDDIFAGDDISLLNPERRDS